MRILLIGEASGVHRLLRRGLEANGAEVEHVVAAPARSHAHARAMTTGNRGVLGGIERHVRPMLSVLRMPRYDVVNFSNTITMMIGRFGRYLDVPALRRKARVMSYYALSCDELGLIRENALPLPYTPCASCQAHDGLFPRDCNQTFLPNHARALELAQRYFDCGFSAAVEYDAAAAGFSAGRFRHVQFPIDVSLLPFTPARTRGRTRIVHTPTRRGFKGTAVVLEAIERLERIRSDFEFQIIEGLSHDAYLEAVAGADIVIDQVYSQSAGMNALEMLAMGKVVLSGNTEVGRSYFPFLADSPMLDASPDPRALCASLEALLDRRAEFESLAQRGRDYVAANHDHRMVAGLFLESWREVMTTAAPHEESSSLAACE